MIKKYLILVILSVNSLIFAQTFYVSPNGSDSFSGTFSEATANDGPFSTLARARDAVRSLKKSEKGNITVFIRGGRYELDETIVFSLKDSGEGDQIISYQAYQGETPVFSSGTEIKGWKKVKGKLAGLPIEALGKVYVANTSQHFFTLFDENGLLPRAQSKAFFPGKNNSKTQLELPVEQVEKWSNLEEAEVVIRPHHAWIVNILPLESVDRKKGIIKTSLNATYAMNKLHYGKKEKNCWIENVLEELDAPGEWVLNSKDGKVYLWPRDDSPVMAPTLNELIRVEGEIDYMGPEDVPVRNLVFSGLTFMHGKRYQQLNDDKGLQHDWDMLDKDNALFRLRGTEKILVENCHFLYSGSGAIRVDLHGMENRISGNHIEHMGGAGVLLCGYGPGTKDVNKNNLVYNNNIHHVGEVFWHSPGIMVWQSGENRIANNLIHHTDYTPMILSGFMSHFMMRGDSRELVRTMRRHEMNLPERVRRKDALPYLHSRNNILENNEIHHGMLRLGDGNAIYIRGAGEGNVIRRNYIHDMVGTTQMQSAIRTDGGQTGTLIAENLIYKCTSQGILIKLNNKAINNIVANVIAPPRGYYLSLREGPMNDAVIQKNIFYSTSAEGMFINELLPKSAGKSEDRRGRKLALLKDTDADYNIYFCKPDPIMAATQLEKNQSEGVDLHSSTEDPLFVDPENGDFTFKPNSPALKMGIVPIDTSKIGLRKE